MAVNQQAIDRIKLDEAFATETYKPFHECWTVRMDSELMVIDDDEEKFSRFTDNPDDAQKEAILLTPRVKNKSHSKNTRIPGNGSPCVLYSQLLCYRINTA